MPTFDTARPTRPMTAARQAEPSRYTTLMATGPTLSLVPLTDRPDGARIALSPCSPLIAGLAPLAEIDRLLAVPALAGHVAYALIHRGEAPGERPEIRWGETVLAPQRLRRHRATPPLPIEEVVLIGATTPHALSESALLALQEALTHQASRAGRARVIGAGPQRAWLAAVDPGLIARWLADLRGLLVALGCPLLEPRGAVLTPRIERLPATLVGTARAEPALLPAAAAVAVPSGYTIDLPAGLTARADAARFTLDWRGLRARAVVAGGWTVLREGSYLNPNDRGGIQDCLSRKRAALRDAGIVRPMAGGRLRLTRDLGLPSLVNAARVITGGNERDGLWIRH